MTTHFLREVLAVSNLTRVGLDRGDRPGLQACLPQQRQVREWIPGIRVDGIERALPSGAVVGMTAPEALPIPLRAPGDDPLRPDLADDAHELAAQPLAARL
jgi:hypothetical protein